MDKIKEQVAAEIQNSVLHARIWEALGLPAGEIEISPVDKLNTVIRVRGHEGRGPRYFLVKMSEQL